MGHIFLGSAELKKHNTENSLFQLGAVAQDGDHLYRYVQSTAAITANESVTADIARISVTNITGFDNTGDRALGRFPYVEDSSETWTVGQLVGSYVYIATGTGAGQMKRINENSATRAYFEAIHKGFGINHEDDPFGTAPDTTSDIVIISPWGVKKTVASTKIQQCMGVAPFAFTADYYGWICVSGPLLSKAGTTGAAQAAHKLAISGDNTAGQLTGALAGTDDLGDATPAGWWMHVGADDQTTPLMLLGYTAF